MTATKHGMYKLAKQTGTTARFAQVAVRIEPCASDKFVSSARPDAIRGWTEAALAGAEDAILELRNRGVIEDGWLVDVTDFVGIPTDTSDADARWAAFMAVVSAFPSVDGPTLDFSRDRNDWILSWPTPRA